MISAKILLDSICESRITTFELTYPRFIHSEFMTHRVFSRNAASSRAIPIEKSIEAVMSVPAAPEVWGKNQKGMQAREVLEDIFEPTCTWLNARNEAVKYVQEMQKLGVHKQIANRLIEPFSHITVIATATDLDNFFALRAHPDAQPEFQVLAYKMLDLYLKSNPRRITCKQWHIPFVDEEAGLAVTQCDDELLMISAARCARVSYTAQNKEFSKEDDIALAQKLSESGHWSPFEHVAKAAATLEKFGNLTGFKPLRKFFNNENREGVDLWKIMSSKPDFVKI